MIKLVKKALFPTLVTGLLFVGGGVLADTFIGGHRLFFDRVNDRGVTDNQILKYDAATNMWLPDTDDVGEDTALPSNDTASATLRGNDAGDGWEQNTSLKSTSGGVVTLTGASAAITLEKGGSESASTYADDLVIRDVDGTGDDFGISILTDGGTDAYGYLVFGSGTVENNSWIRADDTYMDIRVDETVWVGSTSSLTTFKLDTNIPDERHFSFGTGEDFKFEYNAAAPTVLKIHDGTNTLFTFTDQETTGLFTATGDLAASDDVSVGDDLTVTGLATVGETLGVTGLLTASAGLTIPDDQTLTLGDVTLTYDETTDDRLEITGATYFGSAVTFGENITVSATKTITAGGGAFVVDSTGSVDALDVVVAGDIVTEDGAISIEDGSGYDLLTIEDDGTSGRLVLTGTDVEISTAGIIVEDGDANSLFTIDDDATVGDVGVTGDLAVAGEVSTATLATTGNVTFGNASTDTATFVGRLIPRQTATSPMSTVAGTEGEIVYNTTDNTLYVCQGGTGPWTWAALH